MALNWEDFDLDFDIRDDDAKFQELLEQWNIFTR
jgi:uncharacterized protein YjbK